MTTSAIPFEVNGQPVTFEQDPETPLLWVLRDHLQFTGTKFGCGAGHCGACTVHVNGRAQRACMTPVVSIKGASIVTIEGLAEGETLHPVQQAWLEQDVPQCGYCQAGQILATVDLLKRIPQPSDEQIDEQLTNLCRCGTYVRIRKAVHRAAQLMQEKGEQA